MNSTIIKITKTLSVAFIILTSSVVLAAGKNVKIKAIKQDTQHELRAAIHKAFPHEHIFVTSDKEEIILTGNVNSHEVAEMAEKISSEHSKQGTHIINMLKVKASQQVMLRVKIGEVMRDVVRNYNSNKTDYDYLEQRGAIRTLSEPNLVAMNGERAEFMSGGEFPVPVTNEHGQISVIYKSYGVKLIFTPHVISSNKIKLNIDQELSEITHDNNIVNAGMKIPAIYSKKAKTSIQLASGESFMIAGLVKEDYKDNRGKEKEIVISVTPYLVEPVASKDIKLPTDNMHKATKLEENFIERITKNSVNSNAKKHSKLNGPVGFIAE